MNLIPNVIPIMSFGVILLFYAIFINYLISKKKILEHFYVKDNLILKERVEKYLC